VRSEGQFNTIVYEQEDTYRSISNRWSVLMSQEDLARLRLQRGDQVTLRSAYGTMEAVEVHPFDLPAGNLLAYFPEANVLIGTEVDPRSRTPAFKSIQVAVQINPAAGPADSQPHPPKPPQRAPRRP
ncbi:MAG: molybdopterin dinucleotide binding domain-containing protein, partial [Pseudomonadota bacterium]